MSALPHDEPEFSRRIALESLGDEEVEKRFSAGAAERQALAARLGLISLDRLDAVLWLRRPTGGNLVRLRGRFEADLSQACVVTLEPVPDRIVQDFALLYSLAPEGDQTGAAIESVVEVDMEQEEPPEALDAPVLDLGEAVVQQLAVAIEPYPRAAGADLDELEWSAKNKAEKRADSPFQVLESLKRD